jgi:hypothetical protein
MLAAFSGARRAARRGLMPAPLLVALLCVGCTFFSSVSTTRQLREAQDAFSAAAATENAARLQTTAPDPSALGSGSGGYAQAAEIAGQLRANNEADLRRDGLYCSALAVEAMARWRLGQRDKARTLAAADPACTGPDAYPRDRTLLLALPGLVQADDAYALTRDSVPNYDTVEANVLGAIDKLQGAAAAAGPDAPVATYLAMAQLAVLRTWSDAIFTEKLPPDQQQKAQKHFAEEREKALGRYMSIACPIGQKASVDYWSALLGSTTTCRER